MCVLAPTAFMISPFSVTCTLGYLFPSSAFCQNDSLIHLQSLLSPLWVSRNESRRSVASLLTWMELGSGTFNWKIYERVGPRKGSGEVIREISYMIGNRIIRESNSPEVEWFTRKSLGPNSGCQSARVQRHGLLGYVGFR